MSILAFFHSDVDVCFSLLCCPSIGEALTQSSLLEADGETITTVVEPMNLHHAMLRSPGR